MAVFSASQEKQAKVGFKESKTGWQHRLSDIEKNYSNKAFCTVYGFITPIGDVLKLGGNLKLSGLKKGDRVQSVNSIIVPSNNFFRFINQFGPDETLSLKVLREGSSIDIEIQCTDGSKTLDIVKRTYKTAISKKWDDCKASAHKVLRITGIPAADLLWTYARCAELQVSLQGQPLNRNHASNYYQSLKANLAMRFLHWVTL